MPPFKQIVSSKLRQKFLHLIEKHFPRNNPLSKIFNRNTLKLSYNCTDNIEKIIKKQNFKSIQKPE